MDDVIYERETDRVDNVVELVCALRKRERTDWRLVAIHTSCDGTYAVWERAASGVSVPLVCPTRARVRELFEDPAQASTLDSVPTKLREMQATGRRDLQASGDRREWENSSTLETELRVVDAIIAMVEGTRAEVPQ